MKTKKMKKSMALLVLVGLSAFGQQATIGLKSTQALTIKNAIEAEKVFQKIKEVVLTSGTYEILDREALGIVIGEQEIQKQITSINAKVVNQGKIKGAEFIIASKLYNVSYKKIAIKEPKPLRGLLGGGKGGQSNLVRAIFSFSVDILDTETGATVNSQKFSVGTYSDNFGGTTEEGAFDKALNSKSLEKKLTQFLNDSEENAIKLVAIEQENETAAELVLINTGSSSNTKKNSKFKVYEVSVLNIDGEKTMREKWVADLKVSAVEGKKLSVAKVEKGGQKLKELHDSGAQLICKAR